MVPADHRHFSQCSVLCFFFLVVHLWWVLCVFFSVKYILWRINNFEDWYKTCNLYAIEYRINLNIPFLNSNKQRGIGIMILLHWDNEPLHSIGTLTLRFYNFKYLKGGKD